MQFPVPQFTDVEDKIIGPLTIIQFGIVFGAGIIVFLGYSATKSVLVLVFLLLLFGLPAIGLAFVPFNGRPIYKNIGTFVKYFSGPRVLIFHKEAQGLSSKQMLKDAQLSHKEKEKPVAPTVHQPTFKEVQTLLAKTADQEREVAGKFNR